MRSTSTQQRRFLESLDRSALELLQISKLNAILQRILPENRFYAEKFRTVKLPLESLDDLRQLPFTTKDELAVGGDESYAANRTYGLEMYVRFHRTSGTHTRPLIVLDTAEDW